MKSFSAPPMRRWIRQEQAEEFVGGAKVLKDLESAGWVKPIRRTHRLTLWDAKLLDRACDRIWTEELPCWKHAPAHGDAPVFSLGAPPPRYDIDESETYTRTSKRPTAADVRRLFCD